MNEDTLSNIEAKIQASDSIKDDRKRELLQLIGTLKSEIANLSKTNSESAQSIAGFTEISAHEATRSEQNPELLHIKGPDDSDDRNNLLNFAHGAVVVSRTGEFGLEIVLSGSHDGEVSSAADAHEHDR